MIKASERAAEAYKNHNWTILNHEHHRRRLQKLIDAEQKIMKHIENNLIREHATVQKGERFKSDDSRIWEVEHIIISYWNDRDFQLVYHLQLLGQDRYYTRAFNHTELNDQLQSGKLKPVAEGDKPLAKNTKLRKILFHEEKEWNYTYIGVTAKGKYILFSSINARLHKDFPDNSLRLSRTSTGEYTIRRIKPEEHYFCNKADHMLIGNAKVLGVFRSRVQLTAKLLAK